MFHRLFCILVLALAASGAAAQRLPATEAQNYERCMALARKDPTAGWERALAWRSEGGRHPAEHCAAVALLGLKQYAEAGKRLEALAEAMRKTAPAQLQAEVLGQAGQAWFLAGSAARAHAVLTAALTLAPDDPDLLTDRAAAAGALGKNDEVVADMGKVLARDPRRTDALTFRASALRQLQRLEPALADIQQALKLAPDQPEALLERGNILRLKGDAAGARRDWLRVGMVAPGTEADAAAKSNLEKLDLKQP